MKFNIHTKNMLLLLIIFIFSTLSSSFAGIVYKTIQVEYHGIKININGSLATPEVEPFIYSNRTMVPLRFVAEGLNKEVVWNEITKTIEINNKGLQKPLTLNGSGQKATEKFTLPKGLATFKINYSGEGYFSVTLLDENGNYIEYLTGKIGESSGSKAVKIEKAGIYLMNVQAEGDWTITIE